MSETVPKTKGYLLADPAYAHAWRVRRLWRPLFSLVYVGFFAALGLTVLFLLIVGLAQLADASNLLIAMVGAGGLVTGAHTVGRSWEKRHGADGFFPPDPGRMEAGD
ncbi:hypothetical protein FDK21_19445 [Cohaesibacter sp. CAU 1516]|uniref:hypothetical protein n=1 Tax=Cohaesibacter sp. CAU 1516 TaxID=2576038 RepID=UPI0010FD3E74|nr:hypothetical protein [Cohaesibacter sp. CAU 1516]TLP42690.1 hypothetical protein FDK21_19445 [Cohaesibacter sp. CAU 1516]